MTDKIDLHKRLCAQLYDYLIEKGFKRFNFSDIRTSQLDTSLSLQAGRWGVDAVAEREGVKYYFEVETRATLRATNTTKQLISMADCEGKKFLIIPPEAYEEAENVLRLRKLSDKIKILSFPL